MSQLNECEYNAQ